MRMRMVTCSAEGTFDANVEVWPGGSSRLRSNLKTEINTTVPAWLQRNQPN